jgi:hypothetical protein
MTASKDHVWRRAPPVRLEVAYFDRRGAVVALEEGGEAGGELFGCVL